MKSNNDMDERPAKKLPLHEWSIVLLFCLILLLLAVFAIGKSKPEMPRAEPLPPFEDVTVLQVRIEGEVRKPGLYRLPVNVTVNDLLIQAEALPSADLSELNWRRRLRNNQTIKIPKRRLIVIQIKGAVKEPAMMEILSGTRYCHLVDLLPVLPDADLTGMRKKRGFVCAGDCVEVPSRRKKQQRKRKGRPQ